ncbi:hypothetical protein TNCV_1290241 [Trichonephila clavipes]|nr:hypothetical protein TNCV_1290241 [Trichonephila clavipes]
MTSSHSCTRFIVDNTIEDVHVCDAVTKIVATIVSELRIRAAENVVEMSIQTLVVLLLTPILDSELVT